MAIGDLGDIQAPALGRSEQLAGSAAPLLQRPGELPSWANSRARCRLETPVAAATRSQLRAGSSRCCWMYCLAASR